MWPRSAGLARGPILEARELLAEVEPHHAGRAVALLLHDDLGEPFDRRAVRASSWRCPSRRPAARTSPGGR